MNILPVAVLFTCLHVHFVLHGNARGIIATQPIVAIIGRWGWSWWGKVGSMTRWVLPRCKSLLLLSLLPQHLLVLLRGNTWGEADLLRLARWSNPGSKSLLLCCCGCCLLLEHCLVLLGRDSWRKLNLLGARSHSHLLLLRWWNTRGHSYLLLLWRWNPWCHAHLLLLWGRYAGSHSHLLLLHLLLVAPSLLLLLSWWRGWRKLLLLWWSLSELLLLLLRWGRLVELLLLLWWWWRWLVELLLLLCLNLGLKLRLVVLHR